MPEIIKHTRDDNGERHSYNDETAIEYSNGDKHWYCHGKLHRDNGPAIIDSNGDKYWFHHGKVHRDNGPAVEYGNGVKFWYINDKCYTLHEWIKMSSLPDEQKMEALLSHA